MSTCLHRYFSHKGFKCGRVTQFGLYILGCLASQVRVPNKTINQKKTKAAGRGVAPFGKGNKKTKICPMTFAWGGGFVVTRACGKRNWKWAESITPALYRAHLLAPLSIRLDARGRGEGRTPNTRSIDDLSTTASSFRPRGFFGSLPEPKKITHRLFYQLASSSFFLFLIIQFLASPPTALFVFCFFPIRASNPLCARSAAPVYVS